ncbi:MAG: abortive infection family protein [Candidatus Moraniibacteriota bacterium]
MVEEEKERINNVIAEFEKKAIGIATNFSDSDYEQYESARNDLLSEPLLHPIIPDWIIKYRWGGRFRSFMQQMSGQYAPRRKFIWDSIHELRQFVERGEGQPVSLSFDEIKHAIKTASLEGLWKKIHARRDNDPEGAITASKTMLESTMKYILDELGEEYSEKEDMLDLYKKVSQELNLSPGNHHEKIFKQILQGVSSVIVGFSSLRNKYGDAHGKGKLYVGPDKRHADLAVNLSGTICTFLIETFRFHSEKKQ